MLNFFKKSAEYEVYYDILIFQLQLYHLFDQFFTQHHVPITSQPVGLVSTQL